MASSSQSAISAPVSSLGSGVGSATGVARVGGTSNSGGSFDASTGSDGRGSGAVAGDSSGGLMRESDEEEVEVVTLPEFRFTFDESVHCQMRVWCINGNLPPNLPRNNARPNQKCQKCNALLHHLCCMGTGLGDETRLCITCRPDNLTDIYVWPPVWVTDIHPNYYKKK